MITLKIFNNKIIVANKHGNRFCGERLKIFTSHSFDDEFIKNYIKDQKGKFFIVRNPEDYFYSAFKTEFFSDLNDNIPENEHDFNSLNNTIEKVLFEMYNNTRTHYDINLYKKLNNLVDYCHFVDIENLSSLIMTFYNINKEKNGFIYDIKTDKYDKSNYSHENLKYTMSETFMKSLIQNDHREIHHHITQNISKELEFYNKLVKLIPDFNSVDKIINNKSFI